MERTIMKRHHSQPRRRAFTLIELLVVIAILAALFAILMPALSGAKSKGLQADCAGGMHQLHVGLTEHITSQAAAYYPLSDNGTAGFYKGTQRNLLQVMSDYISSNSPVWFCKRYLKDNKLSATNEVTAGRIGYYYWVTNRVDLASTNTAWTGSGLGLTNMSGILMSDRFDGESGGAARQYHGGTSTAVPLNQPGTHIMQISGSIQRVIPKP
jgi:prepilin-type N-terminal cleavage/methylation domain-containing protein